MQIRQRPRPNCNNKKPRILHKNRSHSVYRVPMRKRTLCLRSFYDIYLNHNG